MFASGAYVPVASLPTWLQVVAKVNPLSYTVDAARGLALGHPDGAALGKSLLIAAVVAAVAVVGATTADRRIDR
jgi:ABC-2 type transport system permease protein